MTDILHLVFRTFSRKEGAIAATLPANSSSVAAGDPDLNRSSLVLGDPDLSRTSLDLSRSSLDPSRSSLVLGDPDLSRSLLLLSAVAAASDLGLRVLFFTQTQIQSLPMCLQKCLPTMSPDSLKKIEFWYPRTLEDLLQQISSLHESSNTTPCPPSLLIVDRLQGYLSSPGSSHTTSPEDQSRAAHLSALLMDTSSFLTSLLEQRRPSSAPCRVLASYRPEDGEAEAEAKDQVLQVLDRYFQVRCTLDQVQSYESASVQELWRVFLSHTDTSEDSQRSNGTAGVKEWLLNVSQDGFMEFKTV